jgi:hypothetical protein
VVVDGHGVNTVTIVEWGRGTPPACGFRPADGNTSPSGATDQGSIRPSAIDADIGQVTISL